MLQRVVNISGIKHRSDIEEYVELIFSNHCPFDVLEGHYIFSKVFQQYLENFPMNRMQLKLSGFLAYKIRIKMTKVLPSKLDSF